MNKLIAQAETKFNAIIAKAETKIAELELIQNDNRNSWKVRNEAYCLWSSIYRLGVEIGNDIVAYRTYETYRTDDTISNLNKKLNRFAKLVA